MLRNLAQLQENKYTATGAGICLKYRHKDSGSTGFHSYLCYSYFSTESEPKSCRLVFGLTTTFIRWGLKGSHKSKDGRIFSTHRRSYYPSIWSYEVVMWPRGYLCSEYLDSGWKSQRRKKKPVNPLKPSFCFCHCDELRAPLIVIPPLILLLSLQTGKGLLALQVQTDEGVTERGAPKPGRHPLLQPCSPGDL